MSVDSFDPCGVYFGTTSGQVNESSDSGDSWMTIVRDLPPCAVCRGAGTTMIRVVLPAQLCTLADVRRKTTLQVQDTVTLNAVLDALGARHPMLRKTIRDQVTHERQPFIRFFACGEDLSLYPPTSLLPENVVTGKQLLRIVGAMAGG